MARVLYSVHICGTYVVPVTMLRVIETILCVVGKENLRSWTRLNAVNTTTRAKPEALLQQFGLLIMEVPQV